MNIETLRLSLAVCGVLLVAGIYLFDRLRRKPKPSERESRFYAKTPLERFSLQATADDPHALTDLPSMRIEPFEFDPLLIDDSASQTEVEIENEVSVAQKSSGSKDLYRIVQLKVTSRKGNFFSGPFLISALRSVGLEFGSMDIFHKQAGKNQSPLFSVVNLLEPGTFPVKDPSRFESPGVAFFLQIAMADQPHAAFDEMLRTARMLAARIDGEIRDAENQLLTVEKTETIRGSLAPVAP
ncbi:MAG: cell division protein ZipA C-terminal FtsZ-binding domain-containing protein [Methylococcales bacterium]